MISALVRSLRPQQWTKNLFVLAPLVFAQRLTDSDCARRGALAFVAFCAAASAIYLVNDLRDREEDRHHPLKRLRPIASGRSASSPRRSPPGARRASPSLIGARLGTQFLIFLAVYLALNVAYTLGLKAMVILDVMTIALGFVLRVLGRRRGDRRSRSRAGCCSAPRSSLSSSPSPSAGTRSSCSPTAPPSSAASSTTTAPPSSTR